MKNFRLGFATNSSSSHSVILLAPGETIPRDNDYGDGYGWEWFTLSSEESKKDYLFAQIRGVLRSSMDDWMAETIANRIAGTNHKESSLYVDHQSLWGSLPKDFSEDGLHLEFLEDLATFMKNERVVVYGGNDNDDGRNDIPEGKHLDLGRGGSFKAKKDGDGYVLFDTSRGTKLTVFFGESERREFAAPELIDIKITDYCPYACEFCYMGSTPEGKHADTSYMWSLACKCRSNEVFEVALGGGEPTLHPKFMGILQDFHYNKVTVNFTTRNIAFLEKNDEEISKLVGAVAVSMNGQPGAAYERLSKLKTKITLHWVMGINHDQFQDFLDKVKKYRFGVTLLGYKTTGRGCEVQPDDYSDWMEYDFPWKVGVDTVLASQFEEEFEKKGVPQWMYYTKDGLVSCYIDAVNKKIAKASFSEEMHDLGNDLIEGWEKAKE